MRPRAWYQQISLYCSNDITHRDHIFGQKISFSNFLLQNRLEVEKDVLGMFQLMEIWKQVADTYWHWSHHCEENQISELLLLSTYILHRNERVFLAAFFEILEAEILNVTFSKVDTDAGQRTLTYSIRGSITVQLSSCLTDFGFDPTSKIVVHST